MLAGFAETFVNPVTAALVLALACLLLRPMRLRLAAGLAGPAVALPDLAIEESWLVAGLAGIGAAAAGLLYAECMLHFVLPACRLGRRLARDVLQRLSGAGGPPTSGPPPSPGGPSASPGGPPA